MQLLNAAKLFLEQALKTEEGKKAVKAANIHCREQLLFARVMANEWKARSRTDWQSVIDQCNNEHPAWSPLANANRASGYAVPEESKGNLALVLWKYNRGDPGTLISAEDQFVSLHQATEASTKVKVHGLVQIAYGMYRASSTDAVAFATAVPSVGGGTAEQDAKIDAQKAKIAELERLCDVKDKHLADMKQALDLQGKNADVQIAQFSPGFVSGTAVTGTGAKLVEMLQSKEEAQKKAAGTSCYVAFYCAPLQIISLTMYPLE